MFLFSDTFFIKLRASFKSFVLNRYSENKFSVLNSLNGLLVTLKTPFELTT